MEQFEQQENLSEIQREKLAEFSKAIAPLLKGVNDSNLESYADQIMPEIERLKREFKDSCEEDDVDISDKQIDRVIWNLSNPDKLEQAA